MATGSAPGVCCLCRTNSRTRAVATYTDPDDGYTYHLCARHYEPIRRWRARLAEREAKRRAGGIVTAEDFVRHEPDGR
jgi:hypothetical protein